MKQREKIAVIKSTVTMPDILNIYGFDGNNRRRRLPCPIHDGDNREGFSFNKELFQCFICKEKGDVITFVMKYCNMDFNSAMDEINRHFNLWDDSKPMSFSEKFELQKKIQHRKEEKEKRERKIKHFEDARLKYLEIDSAILNFAPKSPDDEWDDRYCEALMKRDYQSYIMEITTRDSG